MNCKQNNFPSTNNMYFFQARKHPKLILCLQNGYFDHPDRMFNKVSDTFRNCLNNMADFKVKYFSMETFQLKKY